MIKYVNWFVEEKKIIKTTPKQKFSDKKEIENTLLVRTMKLFYDRTHAVIVFFFCVCVCIERFVFSLWEPKIAVFLICLVRSFLVKPIVHGL